MMKLYLNEQPAQNYFDELEHYDDHCHTKQQIKKNQFIGLTLPLLCRFIISDIEIKKQQYLIEIKLFFF